MFKIVSSSAGSGKTYTLTKEYLKLVLKNDNPFYFKHILAITFTKAATREMKERILGRLEAFADANRTDPMLADIVGELHPEALRDIEGAYRVREHEIRQRAGRIFRQILHNYSDFAVMTIDSFVQRIVSAFTDELELPYSFEVEMEAQEILLTAVERMLEKAGNDTFEDITEVLEDFYLGAIQDGQNHHTLPETLASFAADLLQENRYAAIKENANLTTHDIKKIRIQMIEAMKTWEQAIIDICEKALQTIAEHDLYEEDFSAGTVYKYFKKRSQAEKVFEEAGKMEYKAFEENTGWTRKTEKLFTIQRIESIKPNLVAYYEAINTIKAEKAELYYLYQQLTPYLHNLALLNAIKEEFDAYLRENNRVHISEFNQKILKIVVEDPVPFIYERLGEKFNHILIDEFQDTSKLQFANLLPLIDNSLGYEHFNLAVGDSKQAIYRFRGGDMDQIIALHTKELDLMYGSLGGQQLTAERLENISRHLEPDALNTNRRSAQEIVNFNNAFFQTITDNYQNDFPLSKKVFTENFQQLVAPNAPVGGQVSIEFLESITPDTEEESTPVMIERTWHIVKQVIEEGFEQADISILCRRVQEAKLIANYLKDNGYNVISEDSLSLRFSGAINLLTAFMRVLIQPDNKLQKYEALYLFFRIILQRVPTTADTNEIKNIADNTNSWVFYQYINGFLQHTATDLPLDEDTPLVLDPYNLLQISTYELTEKLIRTFNLFEIAEERDYLFKFLDLVLEYGTHHGAHLSDFIEHWETKKDKISISAPSNQMAITVQTIHRSKGLEYPVVIIPYADWSFTPNPARDTMWVQLRPTEETILLNEDEEVEDIENIKFLRTGAVKLKSDLQQTPQNIAKQYAEEQERVFVENLNLLYVAFTRPTHRLYILAKNQDFLKTISQKKVSYWLHQFLMANPDFENLPTVSAIVAKHKMNSTAQSFYVDTIVSVDRSQSLRLRRLADRLFDVETFERKRDYTQKIYAALSYINTTRDVNTALIRLKIEGLIEQNESDTLREKLQQIITNPALKNIFIESTYSLNQREILTPTGDLYCPSRVVQIGHKIIIVDYKTTDPADTDIQQIQRYIKLYKAMGYTHVEAKLYYIEQDQIVDLV